MLTFFFFCLALTMHPAIEPVSSC